MKRKLNCVLLIDDDTGINFINHKIIDKLGIAENVKIVLNGREAIDYLTNKGWYEKPGNVYPRPDLIFLDINMPVMDGWEFLEAYRQLEDNQKCEIIIVMLTTSLNPDDKKRAETIAEISGFRNKPLEFEMVEEIVKIYFPQYF